MIVTGGSRRAVVALFLLVGLVIAARSTTPLAAQAPMDPPPFHEGWFDRVVPEGASEVQWFVDAAGDRVSISTTRSPGGTLEVRWSERGRAADASFRPATPWTLERAGALRIDGKRTVSQEVAGGEAPHRRWRVTTPDEVLEGDERLPAPPTTELHLAAVLRGVAWEYGDLFVRPLLWNLDDVPADGPEPLRRATIDCTSRETVRRVLDEGTASPVQCWRVLVGSQGRIAPFRTVYWIAVKPPYLLERIECADGRVLEREDRRIPEESTVDLRVPPAPGPEPAPDSSRPSPDESSAPAVEGEGGEAENAGGSVEGAAADEPGPTSTKPATARPPNEESVLLDLPSRARPVPTRTAFLSRWNRRLIDERPTEFLST